VSGAPAIVVLNGYPGVGKLTIARAMRARAEANGHRLVRRQPPDR
jgi:MoxR-like ATPase